MSRIPCEVDYVKMAQMVSFGKFLVRRMKDKKLDAVCKRYVDEMDWNLDKITKILDEAIPPHTLKAVKGGE